MPEIKAVIFDVDGLMLDSELVSQIAWKQTGEENGYDIPMEVHQQVIGLTVEKSAEVMKSIYGEDFPYFRLRKRREAIGHAYFVEHGVPVKPGTTELLDFLEARTFPIAVATSSTRDYSAMKLGKAGLLHRFSVIITGDDITHSKPAPEIYLKAAAGIGMDPKKCLALEDSPPGIRSAHAAGMTPVMVPDLKAPDEDIRQLAHKIFPSLHEVREWLEEIL